MTVNETRIALVPQKGGDSWYGDKEGGRKGNFGVQFEWDENLNLVAVTIPGDIDTYEVQRITRSTQENVRERYEETVGPHNR